MARFTTAEARQQFSEILNQVAYGKERSIVTRRGKELIALIPIEDLHALENMEDALDLQEAKEELESIKHQGSISWEDIKKQRHISSKK